MGCEMSKELDLVEKVKNMDGGVVIEKGEYLIEESVIKVMSAMELMEAMGANNFYDIREIKIIKGE